MTYMWETIQHITTPLALIAFIGALAALIIKRRLTVKKELITSAPPSERADLIEASLETYHLKDDNLTREQKFQLVQKVLDQKIQRQKLNSITAVVLTIIMATTALIGYAITNNSSTQNQTKSDDNIDELVVTLQKEVDDILINLQHSSDTLSKSYKANEQHYIDIYKTLNALVVRTSAIPGYEITAKQIELVKSNIENLEKLHKIGIKTDAEVQLLISTFNIQMTAIQKLTYSIKNMDK